VYSASQFASIPLALQRSSAFLTHTIFNSHHSETQMLRYLKLLEARDLALNFSMI
jgi:glycine dehydrogenase